MSSDRKIYGKVGKKRSVQQDKRPDAAAPVGDKRGEKLQKVLARAGLGSRRELEKWIEEGLIQVNRRTAKIGERVVPEDTVMVRGRLVKLEKKLERPRKILVYNKPVGEIVSRNDPDHKKNVFENLPGLKGERWIPVGRLDINTSGLLLFTTDGELAHRLMHPSYEITRVYAIRVAGQVTDEMIEQLKQGIELDDGMAKLDTVKEAGGEGVNRWYHVSLKEGKTREVRRIWESLGVMVSRLIRIQYGLVMLPREVPMGKWQYVSFKLGNQLATSVGLEAAERSVEKVWSRGKPGHRK